MSKVPCGMTLGHGERCVDGHLCDGCEEINRLNALVEGLTGEVEDLGFIAREKEDQLIAANMRCADAEAELKRMRDDILVRVMASLAAAISLLERGGRAAKKAAPSDKMFDQMLVDYNRALDAAREALRDTE